MKGSGRTTLAAVDGALLITSNPTMTVWTAAPRSDFHFWRSCLWRAYACVASLTIIIFSADICRGSTPKQGSDTDIGRKETSEGLAAFERGAFDGAIPHWEKAVQFYHAQHDSLHEIDARIRLATAYEGMGQFSDAMRSYCRILIGETTYELLDNQFHTKLVGISPLKGKAGRVTIYRVLREAVAQEQPVHEI